MRVIFGSSGFAKELDWLIFESSKEADISNSYFVSTENLGSIINGKKNISENEFLELSVGEKSIKAMIGIGDPQIRRKIVDRFSQLKNLEFPNLIFPNVVYDGRSDKVKFGRGNVICAGCVLTTDIVLGDFVHVNLNCTIGHDSKIGSFTTISPGVHISGNVLIGSNVFIGTGAVVLEKIEICDNVKIGAGAVVNKSILEPGTYIGVPAKRK